MSAHPAGIAHRALSSQGARPQLPAPGRPETVRKPGPSAAWHRWGAAGGQPLRGRSMSPRSGSTEVVAANRFQRLRRCLRGLRSGPGETGGGEGRPRRQCARPGRADARRGPRRQRRPPPRHRRRLRDRGARRRPPLPLDGAAGRRAPGALARAGRGAPARRRPRHARGHPRGPGRHPRRRARPPGPQAQQHLPTIARGGALKGVFAKLLDFGLAGGLASEAGLGCPRRPRVPERRPTSPRSGCRGSPPRPPPTCSRWASSPTSSSPGASRSATSPPPSRPRTRAGFPGPCVARPRARSPT